jgi:hypothetical protein
MLELSEFGSVARPLHGLKELASVAQSPQRLPANQQNADFKAIQKDPRFRQALADPEVQRAVSANDYSALLKNRNVLELVKDPVSAGRLGGAVITRGAHAEAGD